MLWSHISRGRARPVHIENCSFDGKRRFARSVARSASAPSFENCSGAPEFPYTDRAPMCCAIVWRRKWSLEAVRSKRLPMCWGISRLPPLRSTPSSIWIRCLR